MTKNEILGHLLWWDKVAADLIKAGEDEEWRVVNAKIDELLKEFDEAEWDWT